jgi:hypothetical protein
MSYLIATYYKIRHGMFFNLIKLHNIDYPDYLTRDNLKKYSQYNIGDYSDFYIMKRPNGKFICISPLSNIYEIDNFHPCQLSMMKIQFKSFSNTDWTWSDKHINDITDDYISNMILHSKNVINEIIINFTDQQYNAKHIYELKLNFEEVIKKSETSYKDYCVSNIKHFLSKTDSTRGKFNRIKAIKEMYNFLSVNIDFLQEQTKFADTVINKSIEMDNDIHGILIELLQLNPNTDEFSYSLNSVMTFISSIVRCKLQIINILPYEKTKKLFNSYPFIEFDNNISAKTKPKSESTTESESTESESTTESEIKAKKYFIEEISKIQKKFNMYDEMEFYKKCIEISVDKINTLQSIKLD